jgi:hypothetical protein
MGTCKSVCMDRCYTHNINTMRNESDDEEDEQCRMKAKSANPNITNYQAYHNLDEDRINMSMIKTI